MKIKIYFLYLRYPLPFKDDSFFGIFSEYTLKNLYTSETNNLFKEAHRILKSVGIFRTVVLDLEKYIKYYNYRNILLRKNYKFGSEDIWYLIQNFSHRSVWDSECLIYLLEKNGFIYCRKLDCRVS